MDAAGAAVIATQDAVILGRRSYDEWARFWPGSDIEPFATFINTVPKYVATSTPLDPEWANATAIDGGLVDFVRELKNRPGGDIGVHASISVAQTLLAQASSTSSSSWSRRRSPASGESSSKGCRRSASARSAA